MKEKYLGKMRKRGNYYNFTIYAGWDKENELQKTSLQNEFGDEFEEQQFLNIYDGDENYETKKTAELYNQYSSDRRNWLCWVPENGYGHYNDHGYYVCQEEIEYADENEIKEYEHLLSKKDSSNNTSRKMTSESDDEIAEENEMEDSKEISTDKKVEQLVKDVQYVRPNYSKNEILNIVICMFQSFLTVFSGDPGCGKTSICNIMASAMGLRNKDNPRYVPVSVERGWTSKSDFIGFNNPMTKELVVNNEVLYKALINQDPKKPTVILLDEANLSPMEYYWSDFMKVCDSGKEVNDPDSFIHLGGKQKEDEDGNPSENDMRDIPIGKTLHFVATINNDETTESLSPRLIDRAFVITLPKAEYDESANDLSEFWDIDNTIQQKPEVVELSWKDIEDFFLEIDLETGKWKDEEAEILINIVKELHQLGIVVSKRSQQAINKYYYVAKERFEDELDGEVKISASRIALDYAVAQKILPMINIYKVSNDHDNESPLDGLLKVCSDNNLRQSTKILERVIKKGNDEMSMGFYTFF